MVRTRRSGSDRAAFLDAAILTTGVAVLVTVFVIAPVGRDASLSTVAKVVSSAYPVGDVFLLATLASIFTSPGARNSSYRLLLAALALTTVTDTMWNVLVVLSGDTAPDRRWLNVGWLCAYVLVAIAANRPAMAQVAEPAPPTDVRPFGWRRVVAMTVGLLLPPAVLVFDGADGEVISWPVIAIGAGVMCVLVLLRFVDLLSVVQAQAVQLATLARTDALTGVANRRTWDLELTRACQVARDHGRRLGGGSATGCLPGPLRRGGVRGPAARPRHARGTCGDRGSARTNPRRPVVLSRCGGTAARRSERAGRADRGGRQSPVPRQTQRP
jgi:hypothetical protein